MKVDFTPQEKQLVEEQFQAFMQTVTIIARLRGYHPQGIQIADDRSGLVVPDPPEEKT